MMSIPAFTLKKYIKQKKRHLGAGLSYSNQMKFVLNLFPIFLILFLVSIGFLALHNLLLACVLLGLHVLVIFTLINKSVLLKDENY
jgi:hypothetical protein